MSEIKYECQECFIIHDKKVDQCEECGCIDIEPVKECVNCEEPVKIKKGYTCHKCGGTLCRECLGMATCQRCYKDFCNDHQVQCEICLELFCEHCITKHQNEEHDLMKQIALFKKEINESDLSDESKTIILNNLDLEQIAGTLINTEFKEPQIDETKDIRYLEQLGEMFGDK